MHISYYGQEFRKLLGSAIWSVYADVQAWILKAGHYIGILNVHPTPMCTSLSGNNTDLERYGLTIGVWERFG